MSFQNMAFETNLVVMDFTKWSIFNRPKLFTLFCVGIMVFVSIIAASVFFLVVRGAEQTMVPEIRGKDLVDALLELQQKELYPRIELRYNGSAADKGRILEQDPHAGSIVKAGRRIRLVVSQGPIVSEVGNYVGRSIDDVRAELQTLFSLNSQPPLTLKEPMLYQYSTKPAGTILEQNPAPGTGIFAPVQLEFVISRGKDDVYAEMPAIVGLSVANAVEEIGKSGVRFNFSTRLGQSRRNAETVIDQIPAAGAKVEPDTIAEIIVASPARIDMSENEVFKLFKYKLPENPYPLPVMLEVILPGGERRTLVDIKHAGGDFTFPYRLPLDSVLILSMLNREIYRETVR
jgi:beta-lactam-binding protein with PASTA domain